MHLFIRKLCEATLFFFFFNFEKKKPNKKQKTKQNETQPFFSKDTCSYYGFSLKMVMVLQCILFRSLL